jgi:hypothetical protein
MRACWLTFAVWSRRQYLHWKNSKTWHRRQNRSLSLPLSLTVRHSTEISVISLREEKKSSEIEKKLGVTVMKVGGRGWRKKEDDLRKDWLFWSLLLRFWLELILLHYIFNLLNYFKFTSNSHECQQYEHHLKILTLWSVHNTHLLRIRLQQLLL